MSVLIQLDDVSVSRYGMSSSIKVQVNIQFSGIQVYTLGRLEVYHPSETRTWLTISPAETTTLPLTHPFYLLVGLRLV